jgi:hypothetical protein
MPWSSKAARFSVGPPSTTSFDGPLLAATAICHCPSRSAARSWPRNGRESGECRMRSLKGIRARTRDRARTFIKCCRTRGTMGTLYGVLGERASGSNGELWGHWGRRTGYDAWSSESSSVKISNIFCRKVRGSFRYGPPSVIPRTKT